MDDVTLKLATVEQLIDELKARSEALVIGFTVVTKGQPEFHLAHRGRPLECLGLAVALRQDVGLCVRSCPPVE